MLCAGCRAAPTVEVSVMRSSFGLVAVLLVTGCAGVAAGAEPAVVPLERAHSHNDYSRPRPLLDALDAGFLQH